MSSPHTAPSSAEVGMEVGSLSVGLRILMFAIVPLAIAGLLLFVVVPLALVAVPGPARVGLLALPLWLAQIRRSRSYRRPAGSLATAAPAPAPAFVNKEN
jgi:hypothetical protein